MPQNVEVYFTIAKFLNHVGFSLTQNEDVNLENEKVAQQLNCGAIPEFVKISSSLEMYRLFTEANLKNKLLVKSNNNKSTT